MVVESQNQQPSVNVYPNGNGGNYGGGFGDMFGGMGGGAIFFWLILFFFMIMFMGWGGNNGNASGNGGGTVYIPYGAPYMMGGMGGNSIQQNFDQAAVISGINGLQTQMQTGFSNAEVSRCNQQANLLQQMNNNQNTTNTQLQNLNMGLQNCCCENRAAVADLKYTVANEACNDRAAVGDAFQGITAQNNANTNNIVTEMRAGFQSLKDDFCDFKMAQKDQRIAELERQLTRSEIAGMIDTSRQTIVANNDQQTANLEQYLAPVARPAYIVQNPNCCANHGYNQCTQCNRVF